MVCELQLNKIKLLPKKKKKKTVTRYKPLKNGFKHSTLWKVVTGLTS